MAPTTDPVLAHLLRLLDGAPARLAGASLVCVDGRSGSGKSTLADALAAHDATTRVLRLEDHYAGWDGLAGTPERVAARLLEPLARGDSAVLRPWDWSTQGWGSPVVVEPPAPGRLLVLEGVGAGSRCLAAYASVVVWCEAPAPVRRERALARDDHFGDDAGDAGTRWQEWARSEHRLLARERTAERADLVWHSDR